MGSPQRHRQSDSHPVGTLRPVPKSSARLSAAAVNSTRDSVTNSLSSELFDFFEEEGTRNVALHDEGDECRKNTESAAETMAAEDDKEVDFVCETSASDKDMDSNDIWGLLNL